MKKSTLVPLITVLLLFAGVLSTAGCGGDGLTCEGRELPASWAPTSLPEGERSAPGTEIRTPTLPITA
jgi:hypothetical protein